MTTEITVPDSPQSLTDEHGSGAVPAAPAEQAPLAAADNPFLTGNPAAVGLPVFIAGAVALGLVLIGYVPASAVGASLPIIAASTGLGLTLSTVWAAATGQSAVASVFGIFSGFWLSYAVLVLGLTHNWFAITASAAIHAQGLFLISWLITVVLLTLATLRLPSAFTLLFALVDLALLAVLIGTINSSTGWLKIGGVLVFAFAAVGGYLYVGVASAVTGGRGLPFGKPILAG